MYKFILYLAITLSVSSGGKAHKSYAGSQVLLIPFKASNFLKNQLKTGDAEEWHANVTHKEIFVIAHALNEVHSILDRNHVPYTVLTKNLQHAINREKRLTARRTLKEGKKISWKTYNRLDDIYNFTDQLAEDYPNRVSVVNIGKSLEGRLMKVAIFKSGVKNAKKIWIDGGIHAREWASQAVVTYIMNYLAKMNASDNSPLNKVDFYICPVYNPDGYEYTHTTDRLWRKNRHIGGFCEGVDLNRNFKAHWKPSKKCNSQYPGSEPSSELETQHITKFILKNLKNMEGFISFHSFSQLVLYPYAYDTPELLLKPSFRAMVKVAGEIAKKLSQVNALEYKPKEICNYTKGAWGSSVDWAMDVGIKYPYAIELRPDSTDRGNAGFILPPNQIIQAANESLAAVTALASAIVEG